MVQVIKFSKFLCGLAEMSKENSTALIGGLARLKGRENYNTWKFQMKNLLRLDNLWYAVIGYPDGDITDTITRSRRDEKALSRINLMIEINCLSHVLNAETAKDAWEALENAYEDKGLNRRVRLMRSLFSVKLENFNSMEDYVNEILSIAGQLAGIGKPVDDEYIGIIMLQGLPDDYEPMAMALEHSAVEITSDLVKTKLLQDKKWNPSTSSHALSVKRHPSGASGHPKQKLVCWKCQNPGHTKYKKPNMKPGKGVKGPQRALFTALSVGATSLCDGDWFIDSGATNHMSPSAHRW